MPTAIGIRTLTKVFGSGQAAATAVDNVTLDINPGELFFLLGPSGCGKTTLLRMIAGFIEPTEGQILFDGRDVAPLPPNKRNTGMVFQSYALWPHMTVEGNVGFGLNIRRVSSAERARRVQEALDQVRMGSFAKRKPNQLSGGQQQRVALARALVIRPDVLLLDEPLSNLDAKLRIELRSEIRRICKESGITAVYVTHDQKEALSMADRLAIMERGRVVQIGSPDGLYRNPRSSFVAEFLGETNFLQGTVAGVEDRDGDVMTLVDTPAGRLRSRSQRSPGETVSVSIRPEAFRLGDPEGVSGTVVGSTYLGELVQYTVSLGSAQVRVSDLNPRQARREGAVTVGVAPEDVVLLED
jgi:iron(III) transport system ATP-binding protein